MTRRKKKTNELRLKRHITVSGTHCQLIRACFRAQELELQNIFLSTKKYIYIYILLRLGLGTFTFCQKVKKSF